MGHMTSPALYHHTLRVTDNGDISLRMQKAGVVWKSELWDGRCYDKIAHFCAHSLPTPSVEAFAEAFGLRLFHEVKENMAKALSVGDRRENLEKTVLALSKLDLGQPWPGQKECPYGIYGILDALGLSTRWDGRGESRCDYQGTLGNVLHLTWRRFFVWGECANCTARFVTDAGLYTKDGKGEQIRGATMYRFPGLGYVNTHPNGICLLVNDKGRIVGRAIWATPACACKALETVRLQMPSLPKPRPRSQFCERLGWAS